MECSKHQTRRKTITLVSANGMSSKCKQNQCHCARNKECRLSESNVESNKPCVLRVKKRNPRKTQGFLGFRDFEADHRLHFVAFSFEISIGGFNGHPGTKLAKLETANTFFEQKREETKSVVYSKTPKTLGFPGHCKYFVGRHVGVRVCLVSDSARRGVLESQGHWVVRFANKSKKLRAADLEPRVAAI